MDPPDVPPTESGCNDDVLSILDHRLDASGEANVAWFHVQTTQPTTYAWRHETDMWVDKKEMVLAYWKGFDGGRDGQLGVDPSNGPWLPARILNERPKRKKRYQIEWVGYDEDTWEPADTLALHHQHLIDQWVQRLAEQGALQQIAEEVAVQG
ncbi:hypothetical protein CONLIGDRAFT_638363 [Coniochaeta ligniaria NRRL 30616]|uniref:Chromo domain-containing protein n=1 Tax=Coniochaeta ligniaria NRRL 30616 TaxID=1408157 RepID=A0A1J7IMN1_9PEZI|nr:hypothetical protein CONLIGDRAFT_638363 [Coniochaeta ligniaria NRRL 30616]